MTDTTIARFVSRNVISEQRRRPIAWRWRSSRSSREPDQQRAAARAGARRRRRVAARQHGRLRGGLEPRRRKAADAPTPTRVRLRRLRHASCRARARRRSKSSRSTTTRRSASARGWARSRPASLRALDLTLVLDLLRIEEDDDRWGELMKPVVGAARGSAARRRLRRRDRGWSRCWCARPARRRPDRRRAGSTRSPRSIMLSPAR